MRASGPAGGGGAPCPGETRCGEVRAEGLTWPAAQPPGALIPPCTSPVPARTSQPVSGMAKLGSLPRCRGLKRLLNFQPHSCFCLHAATLLKPVWCLANRASTDTADAVPLAAAGSLSPSWGRGGSCPQSTVPGQRLPRSAARTRPVQTRQSLRFPKPREYKTLGHPERSPVFGFLLLFPTPSDAFRVPVPLPPGTAAVCRWGRGARPGLRFPLEARTAPWGKVAGPRGSGTWGRGVRAHARAPRRPHSRGGNALALPVPLHALSLYRRTRAVFPGRLLNQFVGGAEEIAAGQLRVDFSAFVPNRPGGGSWRSSTRELRSCCCRAAMFVSERRRFRFHRPHLRELEQAAEVGLFVTLLSALSASLQPAVCVRSWGAWGCAGGCTSPRDPVRAAQTSRL